MQTDRQDKSAAGWDHIEKVEKHDSQKDYAKVCECSISTWVDFFNIKLLLQSSIKMSNIPLHRFRATCHPSPTPLVVSIEWRLKGKLKVEKYDSQRDCAQVSVKSLIHLDRRRYRSAVFELFLSWLVLLFDRSLNVPIN